jgi:hypothetical protein
MTFSDADYPQDNPKISLKDESGRSLVCQIEQTFYIEGQQYALLLPLDTPVEIFCWEEDESGESDSLIDISDEDINELFPSARAVLAEQELVLHRSAVTLTVVGEIPEPNEDDCFTLTLGDEEEDDDDANSEEFQILATFFHKDMEYTVCTPVDPLLLFAQITDEGEAQVVPPEEFERLRPEIESNIFDVLE